MFCGIFRRKEARQDASEDLTPVKVVPELAPQLSLNNTIKRKAVPYSSELSLSRGDRIHRKRLSHPDGLFLNPIGSDGPVFPAATAAPSLPSHMELVDHAFESLFSHLTITTGANTIKTSSRTSSPDVGKGTKESNEAIRTWLDEVEKPDGLTTNPVGRFDYTQKLENAAMNQKLKQKKAELQIIMEAINIAKEQQQNLQLQIDDLKDSIKVVKEEKERYTMDKKSLKDNEEKIMNDTGEVIAEGA